MAILLSDLDNTFQIHLVHYISTDIESESDLSATIQRNLLKVQLRILCPHHIVLCSGVVRVIKAKVITNIVARFTAMRAVATIQDWSERNRGNKRIRLSVALAE